jgi:hypothetical protein
MPYAVVRGLSPGRGRIPTAASLGDLCHGMTLGLGTATESRAAVMKGRGAAHRGDTNLLSPSAILSAGCGTSQAAIGAAALSCEREGFPRAMLSRTTLL